MLSMQEAGAAISKSGAQPLAGWRSPNSTYMCVYIYMYVRMYVCACMCMCYLGWCVFTSEASVYSYKVLCRPRTPREP